jgi:hypothetical protein
VGGIANVVVEQSSLHRQIERGARPTWWLVKLGGGAVNFFSAFITTELIANVVGYFE